MAAMVARTRSVETVTCWLVAGADAAAVAATGTPAVGVAPAAGPGKPAAGTGVGAGVAVGAAGVATRAGGRNIDGWPLCRFHDSQMKNKEARKMPHSRVRRMSVMDGVRKARCLRLGSVPARA